VSKSVQLREIVSMYFDKVAAQITHIELKSKVVNVVS